MSGYAYAGLAGLQIAGSYFAAQNVLATAETNRRVSDINAEFAELDAYDAEIAGFSEAARYQSIIDQTLSEQQAQMAAADIDTNFGTAAAVQEETKLIGELNKMEIINQAERQALGYKQQSRQFRLGGYLSMLDAQQQASNIKFQGLTGAASTGISYTGYKARS